MFPKRNEQSGVALPGEMPGTLAAKKEGVQKIDHDMTCNKRVIHLIRRIDAVLFLIPVMVERN